MDEVGRPESALTTTASSPLYERLAQAKQEAISTADRPASGKSLSVGPEDDPFARKGFSGPPLAVSRDARVPTSVRNQLASSVTSTLGPLPALPLERSPSALSKRSSASSGRFIEDFSLPLPSPASMGPSSSLRSSSSDSGLRRKGSLLSSWLSGKEPSTPNTPQLEQEGERESAFTPPTDSIRALNQLGVTTKSPKAIEKLTGIETMPHKQPSPVYGPRSPPLLPAKAPSRRVRESMVETLASVRSDDTTLADDEDEPETRPSTADTITIQHTGHVPPVPQIPPGMSSLPAAPPQPFRRKLSLTGRRKPSDAHSRYGSNTSSVTGEAVPTTLGSLYLVSGLSRDPAHWQLAEVDGGSPAHSASAVQRWWRPEVLGTTVAGDPEGAGLGSLDGRPAKTKRSSRRAQHALSGRLLTKEEIARVQAKAMKLSFTRDVEVIASTVAPPSSVHTYSFTVSSTPEGDPSATGTGAIGTAWDQAVKSKTVVCCFSSFAEFLVVTSKQNIDREKTFYAASLIVYSHADKLRTDAIRGSLEQGIKGKSATMARALKAAGAGRRLGKKLETRLSAPTLVGHANVKSGVTSETENETEAFMSESDWDGLQSNAALRTVTALPSNLPLWLPYSLTIVSRWPIYNLMLDVLRISWARYHLSISDHSLSMSRFINTPVVAPGTPIRIPAGIDGTTFFSCSMPARTTSAVNAQLETTQVFWPLFRALSSESLLTICEIALSPLGRIVLFSQYPVLLSIAVQSLKTILDIHGWKGIAHPAIHSRDVRLLLEDPGPYILALHNTQRPLATDMAPEVLVVDLDNDRCTIDNPHPLALSKGGMRLRMRRRLEEAIGPVPYHAVPNELFEAFPSGRFRPFSAVEVNGSLAPAERLMPSWPFDQQRVLIAFSDVLGSKPATGLRRLFFRQQQPRKAVQLDPSTLHIQSIVRRHATNFVDRRDMLEARIGKLNRRLGYLMSECSEWKSHFDTFRAFSNRLDKESADLKNRLEKQGKEARRLSGSLKEQESKREALSKQLRETERARKAAETELRRMSGIRKQLEMQRDAVVAEVTGLASADGASLVVEGVASSLETTSSVGGFRPHSSMSDSKIARFGPSSPSLTSSNGRARGFSGASAASTIGPSVSEAGRARRAHPRASSVGRETNGSEFEMDSELGELGDLERTTLQREAVMETMRSIQWRLQRALLTAGISNTDLELAEHDGDETLIEAPALPLSVPPTVVDRPNESTQRPDTATSVESFLSAVERSSDNEAEADDSGEIQHAVHGRLPMKGMRPFLLPQAPAQRVASLERSSSNSSRTSSTPGRPSRSLRRPVT